MYGREPSAKDARASHHLRTSRLVPHLHPAPCPLRSPARCPRALPRALPPCPTRVPCPRALAPCPASCPSPLPCLTCCHARCRSSRYCENGSLQSICKKFGKFPEALTSVYVGQVLDGLVYLHQQGVIHRDIKVGLPAPARTSKVDVATQQLTRTALCCVHLRCGRDVRRAPTFSRPRTATSSWQTLAWPRRTPTTPPWSARRTGVRSPDEPARQSGKFTNAATMVDGVPWQWPPR